MNLLYIFKIAIAVAGLTLPGYALAKALRLKESLAAAFPFSALLICQTVVFLAILDWKISFAAVGGALTAFTSLFTVVAFHRTTAAVTDHVSHEEESPEATLLLKISVCAAIVMVLAVAFRTTLYPLGGFDTFIRWDALAREILKHGGLSFYPPVTGADFSIYTMADGFPPLVASIYWWIYAATGSAFPQLTSISVTLQLATLLGLGWSAAEAAFGKKAAAFTLLSLTASPLLIRSVELGQESGFLAIAIAGQLCFALVAMHKPAPAQVYAAALFAALGASAREYGPALALPGLLILISHPETRRLTWRYILIAVLATSPWYIRNWVITGSPLYPFMLPGSDNSNRLLTAVLDYYSGIFGIGSFDMKKWLEIAYELIFGGSVAMVAGIAYLALNGRRLYPYTLSLLLIALLWLWSVSKTSGGVIYSMRVLAPAVVILAVFAGKALAAIPEKTRKHLPWILLPAALWGILTALSFPLQPSQISTAILSAKGAAPEFCEVNREFANRIDNFATPSTGILTDSPYLAVILKRETRLRPVIIWSSEVSAILSSDKSAAETSRLLQEKGIAMIALNRSSIHNDFLFSIPFYRDGVKVWQEMAVLDDWVLLAITPVTAR